MLPYRLVWRRPPIPLAQSLDHIDILLGPVPGLRLQHQNSFRAASRWEPKPELRTNIEDRLKVALAKLKQKREEKLGRERGMSL
jgi:hypothetical protein